MTYGRIAIFGICPVNIKTIMLVKTSNPILLTHSCNYKRQADLKDVYFQETRKSSADSEKLQICHGHLQEYIHLTVAL